MSKHNGKWFSAKTQSLQVLRRFYQFRRCCSFLIKLFATFYESTFYFIILRATYSHVVLNIILLPSLSLSSINLAWIFLAFHRIVLVRNNNNNYKTCYVLHSIFTLLREFPFIWLKLYLFIYLPALESWTTVFSACFQCLFIGGYMPSMPSRGTQYIWAKFSIWNSSNSYFVLDSIPLNIKTWVHSKQVVVGIISRAKNEKSANPVRMRFVFVPVPRTTVLAIQFNFDFSITSCIFFCVHK